jgi:hypothetical protein
VPKHGYAAGLTSSSPRFPSCLPRAAECYAAPVLVSSILWIQKPGKRPLNGRPRSRLEPSVSQRFEGPTPRWAFFNLGEQQWSGPRSSIRCTPS